MPYKIRRIRKTRKNCYQVISTRKKRVFSKCSTKKNAEKQIRLLRAIQYNKNFRLRPANRP